MKYMGSKRVMLQNGLGQMLRHHAKGRTRVVDLFAGSGSVAWFASQNLPIPVIASDLQTYSQWLSRAVIERTCAVDAQSVATSWLDPVIRRLRRSSSWRLAVEVDSRRGNAGTWAKAARAVCAQNRGSGSVWRAYGGYYFSPTQAVILDTLRRCIPQRGNAQWVCEAALVTAASRCAASPGHTAQPFATSRTAGPFLRQAWMTCPFACVRAALQDIGPRCATVRGKAIVADAMSTARGLNDLDLVFIDPPYSAVHYSRFYHVLETIARGWCGRVEGTGRYPAPRERPKSAYSQKTTAHAALDSLFEVLARRGCKAIVTFPSGKCSNGLSGHSVQECAAKYFRIEQKHVTTRFSTLGGNGHNRNAREYAKELILVLTP